MLVFSLIMKSSLGENDEEDCPEEESAPHPASSKEERIKRVGFFLFTEGILPLRQNILIRLHP